MSWLELSICVTREAVPAAEAALEQLGAVALTLQDNADVPVLEPDPGATPLWPVVQVRALFDAGVDRTLLIAGLTDIPGADRPDGVRWREVGDQDWVRAWMDRFEPMRFGRRLWIVPGGMSIPADPANVEIRLDPGLAFGTGTHPTTALCLQWLDGQDLAGCRVVDYGCGSGVLGIAAALLGAREVTAVDTDPQAVEATAANAERNSVNGRLLCCSPEEFAAAEVDVVLANILAGPLVDLAPRLAACTRPGAALVLSGLLAEQVDAVADAYRPFCTLIGSTLQEDWARLDLSRRD